MGALHIASQKGYFDDVGADVNSVTYYGTTALHLATKNGNLATMLVNRGVRCIDSNIDKYKPFND